MERQSGRQRAFCVDFSITEAHMIEQREESGEPEGSHGHGEHENLFRSSGWNLNEIRMDSCQPSGERFISEEEEQEEKKAQSSVHR